MKIHHLLLRGRVKIRSMGNLKGLDRTNFHKNLHPFKNGLLTCTEGACTVTITNVTIDTTVRTLHVNIHKHLLLLAMKYFNVQRPLW